MAFLSEEELQKIGFKHLGKDVQLSDKCSIYNPGNIEIGDNSRIDDFSFLSAGTGGIKIGNYVHIATYCSIVGKELIEFKDFSGLASKGSVYSSNDDYSGEFMTNPRVPQEFTNVSHGKVIFEKHVIVGADCVILPNVTIGYGAAVAAFSLVSRDVEEMAIVSGVPAKFLKKRKDGFAQKEKDFISKYNLKFDNQ